MTASGAHVSLNTVTFDDSATPYYQITDATVYGFNTEVNIYAFAVDSEVSDAEIKTFIESLPGLSNDGMYYENSLYFERISPNTMYTITSSNLVNLENMFLGSNLNSSTTSPVTHVYPYLVAHDTTSDEYSITFKRGVTTEEIVGVHYVDANMFVGKSKTEAATIFNTAFDFGTGSKTMITDQHINTIDSEGVIKFDNLANVGTATLDLYTTSMSSVFVLSKNYNAMNSIMRFNNSDGVIEVNLRFNNVVGAYGNKVCKIGSSDLFTDVQNQIVNHMITTSSTTLLNDIFYIIRRIHDSIFVTIGYKHDGTFYQYTDEKTGVGNYTTEIGFPENNWENAGFGFKFISLRAGVMSDSDHDQVVVHLRDRIN